MYQVYAIRCKENGRLYIGCTSSLQTRLRTHFGELRRQTKTYRWVDENGNADRGPTLWQLDYNKFGESAFECYVLEDNIEESNRKERELYWIEEYKSWNPEYGYNIRRDPKKSYIFKPIAKGLPPKPFE